MKTPTELLKQLELEIARQDADWQRVRTALVLAEGSAVQVSDRFLEEIDEALRQPPPPRVLLGPRVRV